MKELRPQGAPSSTPAAIPMDELTARLSAYYEGAERNQQRRHADWRENYTLYRDKVTTNRLVQRQSVNVPLMKETIKTMLGKTDEPSDVYFESLSGDKQKEIFLNEYWKWTLEQDNFETKDTVDKKQEFLYGISTIKLNLFDGRATFEVLEPYDVIFDRHTDPSDVDGTANYLCHRNIFRTISYLSANPLYKAETITSLRLQFASAMGLRLAEQSFQEAQARAERMQDMGEWDTQAPAVGETVVELREHYMRTWDDKTKKLRIMVRVTAAGNTNVLAEGWLDNMLGIDFFPFVKWSDDVERTDMYPDGIGDVARTPNKTLNAFFSQLVENRTLRNFGMTFYDSTKGDGKWVPQTYSAEPFGWYPVAGNPNEVTKRVEIEPLEDSIEDMQFIIGMVERATASTAIVKGVQGNGQQTLGELELLTKNTNERIANVSKFYKKARKELGMKWYKLVEANADKLPVVKLYKKSHKGEMYSEEVKPEDWKDAVGYSCRVVVSGERDAKNMQEVQKLQAIAASFPNNVPFKAIMQKKSLDLIGDLTAEEIQEVLDFEKKAAEAAAQMAAGGVITPNGGTPTPTPAALPPAPLSPQVRRPASAIAG